MTHTTVELPYAPGLELHVDLYWHDESPGQPGGYSLDGWRLVNGLGHELEAPSWLADLLTDESLASISEVSNILCGR